MALRTNQLTVNPNLYPDGFTKLQEMYDQHAPTDIEYRTYGKYLIANTSLLDTPSAVLCRDEVLTNPSQLETVKIPIEGELTPVIFAYFRQEPTTLHLGKTRSVPYLLTRNKQGDVRLAEFTDAMELPGEDPRVIRGVRLRSPNGKVHNGWCISTVIATPKVGNPADVQSIKQVFYWGKDLNKLEPIVEIADLKNTCPFPIANVTNDDSDTTVDIFGRPHPHITHCRISSLDLVTKELVMSGTNLTDRVLPPNVHTGVNTVKAVPGHPNLRELDIHEACAPITPDGKVLHYRLGRYGIDLAIGKLTPLGVIATRSDFPHAEAKPPENGVKDYYDVLYGSMGNPALGLMVTGVSDRHIGLAEIIRAKL
jgi:hypothetical protein